MSKIKSLTLGIKNFFNSYSDKNLILLGIIQKNWRKIVGDAIYFHSLPYKISNNRLFVYVNDNIWVNELAINHDEIKNKISNYTKTNKIEKIFFKFNPEIKIIEKKKEIEKPKKLILSQEKEKEIDNLVSKIEDPILKDALKHYFVQISLIEKDN
ncbi:MAG: DUF721 domain-containing protein [Brevinematales bacterium]|nr:DUF721 domain-containing protein [Brevinematales bacterium]